LHEEDKTRPSFSEEKEAKKLLSWRFFSSG
jgi:hypothetical protein